MTPNFFWISGTSNSLSDCNKNFKKFYRVENFRANVLKNTRSPPDTRLNLPNAHLTKRMYCVLTNIVLPLVGFLFYLIASFNIASACDKRCKELEIKTTQSKVSTQIHTILMLPYHTLLIRHANRDLVF